MSSRATKIVQRLKAGETVKFRPHGNSMVPKIKSGQLVTVEPLNDRELKKDDIVYCKVRGNHYLHLLTAINGERYQISNNHGHVNGWISINCIYGICTNIEN